MTARRSLLVLGLVALGSPFTGACGGEEQPPPAKTKAEEPAPTQIIVPAPEASTSTAGSGGTAVDPFDTEGWGEGETDGDATDGDPTSGDATGGTEPEVTPIYAGPCTVRWTGGPILRFKYEADGSGGLLRIDGDNDGKSDVCARFWTKDGRSHKVTVDEGCNRSTEATITPSYEPGSNVATASYTDQRDGKETKHEITLLSLPAFTGIAPGYPLYAARDAVKLELKDERVVKATVSKPIEGPAVKVALEYDAEGRVTRIKEDHAADGKIDRRFDYRYDEVGNVTGITLTDTDFTGGGKGKKTKKTAKLAYGCWATAAPKPAPSE